MNHEPGAREQYNRKFCQGRVLSNQVKKFIFMLKGERKLLTLEQYSQIRRMAYLEEKSERQIARELGISRHTVSRALASQEPPTYTLKEPRTAPKLGPYQERLEALLEENKRLPKKQRYTAHKLFELLQAEGYSGSESSVAMYAVRWRKSHKRPATFLPLGFEKGQDAQVDWVRRVGAYGIPV
jgi:transposase